MEGRVTVQSRKREAVRPDQKAIILFLVFQTLLCCGGALAAQPYRNKPDFCLGGVVSSKAGFVPGRLRTDPILGRAEPGDVTQSLSVTSEDVQVLSPVNLEFFSDKGRVFEALRADPREAVFHMGFLYDQRNELFEDLAFGGDLGLLWGRFSDSQTMSLTGRGMFTARFNVFSESFDLQNCDFIGGLALGYAAGPVSFEFLIFHQSSHLGDEILQRKGRSRIDYGKEVVRLLLSRQWGSGRIYGGFSFTFHAYPKEIEHCTTLQVGVEAPFEAWGWPMFVAVDVQLLQEHDWSGNKTAKWGVGLGNPQTSLNRQWAFVEVFDGHSNMGQFYSLRESYVMICIGYQFR